MKQLIGFAAAAMLALPSAHAQTCLRNGITVPCDRGFTSQTPASKDERDRSFRSSTTFGDRTYYSDGTTSTRLGGTTYFSDGRSCSTIGDTRYCH